MRITGLTPKGRRVLELRGWRLRWWQFWFSLSCNRIAEVVL